jgi:hypothetical protein
LKQLEFLKEGISSWLCYGCGSAEHTLLIPTDLVRQYLDQMSATSGDDRHYWHIVIQRRSEKLVLRLLGAVDGPDLTPFLVSQTTALAGA